MPQPVRKKSDPALVRNLTSLLEQESRLHEKYLALLNLEREAVTRAAVDKLQSITAEREKVYLAIEEARLKRAEYMARYGMPAEVRLSTWLKENTHPADVRMLRPAVERLRGLAQQSHTRSSEFAQLLGFSLTMVSGCISLLWSATQNIFKCYNPRGELQKLYHPARSRSDTVLKQA